MIYFPHPLQSNIDGLLAIGGELSPDRLLLAYQFGIFPWYDEKPILWWWTHPRCVVYPNQVKVSKSMRSYFNKDKFTVTYNTAFESVIQSCKNQDRLGQIGTWINPELIDSYVKLHELGYAHSVEVWQNDNLVGGLYGVAIGRIFYGESMFAKISNASKFGFISLAHKLVEKDFDLIDCQQETAHLVSMGAICIGKETFWDHIKKNQRYSHLPLELK